MKRWFGHVHALRSLLVIIVMLAGFVGYNLRASGHVDHVPVPVLKGMYLCAGLANPHPVSVTGEPLHRSIVCDGAR